MFYFNVEPQFKTMGCNMVVVNTPTRRLWLALKDTETCKDPAWALEIITKYGLETRSILGDGQMMSTNGHGFNTIKDGLTPLMMATLALRIDVMEVLLEGGANTAVQEGNGKTSLHLAALTGSVEAVRLLLRYGCDVSAADARGQTALHSESLSSNVIAELTFGGCDLYAQTVKGDTPLHETARSGSPESITLLVSEMPDVVVYNHNKATPLHIAADYGRRSEIEAFTTIAAYNDVKTSADKIGRTPLHNFEEFRKTAHRWTHEQVDQLKSLLQR
eukprot:GILI01036504.1.p1 GENE.GILI01036504.1~~GILI01036504.1.p1  ORF type:complete len:275 (-),score=7.77 GILI01036504.1:84-908(-)